MKYPGGKNQAGVGQWIINQMPPHDLYVEAFVGSGAVLRMKRPAAATIAIDCDERLCADLPSLFDAIPAVTVICGDAISHLRKMRYLRRTLVYLDPPYLAETRRSKKDIYDHEFKTPEQHKRLLKLVLEMDCMVMISGYRSSLYDAMLPGWRRIEKVVTLRNGIKATECLWMNYPEPVALHDYRYLGETFRERERLTRIRTNLRAKLDRMTLLERRMLSSMLAEISDASA
jgi:site-specific DNA-adenine methylase